MTDNLLNIIKDIRESLLNDTSDKKYVDEKLKLQEIAETNLDAQYQLYALCLNDGENEKALELCQTLAENDYAAAQYDLSLHFLYGDIVARDVYTAIDWMERAAKNGEKEAARKLANIYAAGSIVRKNPGRSDYWNGIYTGELSLEDNNIIDLTQDILFPVESIKKKTAKKLFDDIDDSYAGTVFEKTLTQEEVINADVNESFVIDGGPGTGKTYVLVKRVAHIVEAVKDDSAAEQIAIISFTNAVKNELIHRFATEATERHINSLRNVDPRTFHSFAYYYLRDANKNCSDDEWEKIDLNFNKFGYEDCMIKGAELIERIPDYVDGWKCLIIDEIQDINDAKALFILKLLDACITYNVPIMMLGDSCQAIYDYLDDDNSAAIKKTSREFYEQVIEKAKSYAQFGRFTVNHRQTSELQQTAELFRSAILHHDRYAFMDAFAVFSEKIKVIDNEDLFKFCDGRKDKSVCLMERNNVKTKILSSTLLKENIEHKCVLAAGKGLLPKWLGMVFRKMNESKLTYGKLNELVADSSFDDSYTDIIWDKLQDTIDGASDIIDFKQVIWKMQAHSLDALVPDEKGKCNLYVSNIHRSKGLEYDTVVLSKYFVDRLLSNDEDEWRVFYVAITRPKTELILMDFPYIVGLNSPKNKKRGRHYKTCKNGRQTNLEYLEIKQEGKYRDYEPWLFDKSDEAQRVIAEMKPNCEIWLKLDCKNETYDICYGSTKIGVMKHTFYNSVVYYANRSNSEMPTVFNEIYIDGVFTAIDQKGLHYSIYNYVEFSGMAHAHIGRN